MDQLLIIILIAVVLGADSFSLAMGMGLKGVSKKYEIRFSSMVGVFHVFMPLLGLYLGMAIGKLLGVWAGRVGGIVLAYIGIDFLVKAYKETRVKSFKFSSGHEALASSASTPETWLNMVVLTISVSIDALTAGFSMGTLRMPILLTVLITGLVAGLMTLLGFKGGKLFSRLVGTYAQFIGGLVLVALAVKMAFFYK